MGGERENEILKNVYRQYVDDTFHRIKWIAAISSISELVLLFLDFRNGFFKDNVWNYLNLAAEILLIVSSLCCFIIVHASDRRCFSDSIKVAVIVAYRIMIMLAVMMFIFTDIYIRHKAIGAYIVFLFVLEITPAYKARVNWIQFIVFCLTILVCYSAFVSKKMNTLFGTSFVFLAFAVSTEYLRRYFIKQYINYFRAKESNQRFQNLAGQSIKALAGAVEAKDSYTKGHSLRVAEYSKLLAADMGFDEEFCEDIYYIGLMHDIGKIGISDMVITKPGRLSEEEFCEIKKHPQIGYDILKEITELPGISDGARWHHERYDGKGYPDGLSGEDIPIIARIIAVADAYDAMTSRRSYRDTMEQSAVRSQIEQNAGKQFDPQITMLMLRMIDADVHYEMRE